MATEQIHTYCSMCVSRCGVLATVEDGRLTKVIADPEHPSPRSMAGGRDAGSWVLRATIPSGRTGPTSISSFPTQQLIPSALRSSTALRCAGSERKAKRAQNTGTGSVGQHLAGVSVTSQGSSIVPCAQVVFPCWNRNSPFVLTLWLCGMRNENINNPNQRSGLEP